MEWNFIRSFSHSLHQEIKNYNRDVIDIIKKHIHIPVTGYVCLILYPVLPRLLQVAVLLRVLWGYSDATVIKGWEATVHDPHSTLNGTLTHSGHSGTHVVRRNLDVYIIINMQIPYVPRTNNIKLGNRQVKLWWYRIMVWWSYYGGTALPTSKSSKISMFFALPQSYQHLFEKKIIYASYSKLSKELKNSIKIKVRQAGFELLIQTNILTVLICNLKTAWPTKISVPFLSSLNDFYKMHTPFFKKLLMTLR